ncbi:MAG: hypothetical protein WC791_04645 [Candidatus Paceibacterota bacterium]|jgi:hypothetical protein
MPTFFATPSITITIFSSPTADPDGDCVVNADDVNPFDPNVFANLIIPAEYSFWEKDRFSLPFSVAGKGIAKLTLPATYYKVSENPIRDAQGVVVLSTSTEVDGIITISFSQNTKELMTYSLELTTKKGNTKERESIKNKRDHESDNEKRHDLEKELDFASAPIILSLQSLSCPNTTSETATVNIYDKQQNAQVQYKYKDIGTLDFVMKSDDVIKIKRGQPLVLTIKVTGAKKNVPYDVSLAGNFTTLSTVQEEEHHDNDDRKQKAFTLFYPLSTLSTQENITVNLTVGGVTKSVVIGVKFEE